MLRVVPPPPPAGQGTDPPKRRGARSAALSLTPDETRAFRAALRNIARAFGGFPVLAGVVGVPVATLYHALGRSTSAALALRIARAAGLHVEALLTPTLSTVGRCNACGSRIAGGAA